MPASRRTTPIHRESVTLVAALLLGACVGGPAAAPATPATPATPAMSASAQRACTVPVVPIGRVQGSTAASPMADETVTLRGVVTADFEGFSPALRGFYMQDVAGDGDAATSDGVFVFNHDRDDVAVGDLVVVTGRVSERLDQTQVQAVSVVPCGAGSVDAVDITLPLASATQLERYEGMLVHMPQELHVTEHYQLGRYGEVVLSAGGRLPQPTAIAAPGADARAVQQRNDLNRIILDDATLEQNPAVIAYARGGAPLSGDNTLRGGDRITGLTGVLTQTTAARNGDAAYRVRPADPQAVSFTAANARPVTPPAVGGTLRIASFNVLNYFNTFERCTGGARGAEMECRGAEDATEFDRQWRKTVAAIVAMDADVVGLLEIENDGYGSTSAIAHLVDRLNAATAPGRYAFIDADARVRGVDVLGTDAIKVGLLYRPARVTPTGRTAALNSDAFVNGGESGPRNRAALAQAFVQPDGGRLVVSINHFKSKGSPCDAPDAGDGQGNCNGARTAAARQLAGWLASDPTGTGDPDVLLLGDLNAYAREDPVITLTRAGYVDLLAAHGGERPYSYVFGGQWGYIDHALATRSLAAQVTGAADWHINADEPPVLDYNTNFRNGEQLTGLYRPGPFRSADHDPVIVGLRLTR